MSQSHQEPDDSGSGVRAIITLSRLFSEIGGEVKALFMAINYSTKNTADWVQQARQHIQQERLSNTSNVIEHAFINYATVAIILRTELSRYRESSQVMDDGLASITSVSTCPARSSITKLF